MNPSHITAFALPDMLRRFRRVISQGRHDIMLSTLYTYDNDKDTQTDSSEP